MTQLLFILAATFLSALAYAWKPDDIVTSGKNKKIYKIEEKIGEGGFANVYSAVCTSCNPQERVAIREFKNEKTFQVTLESYKRIIKAAGQTGFEHLIKIEEPDYFASTLQPFQAGMVCELAESDLQKRIKYFDITRFSNRELPIGESLKLNVLLAEQMVRALNELAIYKMVHGDIKPDNILLTKFLPDRGMLEIKLGDLESIAELGSQISLGTPGYMPPEYFTQSGIISFEADLYALSVTLFKMMSGGDTPFEAVYEGLFKNKYNGERRNLYMEISKKLAKSPKEYKIFLDDIKLRGLDQYEVFFKSNPEQFEQFSYLRHLILAGLQYKPEERLTYLHENLGTQPWISSYLAQLHSRSAEEDSPASCSRIRVLANHLRGLFVRNPPLVKF